MTSITLGEHVYLYNNFILGNINNYGEKIGGRRMRKSSKQCFQCMGWLQNDCKQVFQAITRP